MGFSYRKSVRMGPFRVTASKSGISCSAGVKGARVTKRPSGRIQATLRAPGTGLRYTTTSGTAKRKSSSRAPAAAPPRAASTPKQSKRSSAPTPQRKVTAPRRTSAPKPVRPPKPARLRGNRFSAWPQITAPWLLPFTVSAASGTTVTVHQSGIYIQRKHPKGDLPAVTGIAWQDLTGIDFLEPGRFFSFGHVHFATATDLRGLVTTGADPRRLSGRNPHAVQFIPPSGRAAYRQLRDLLTGSVAVQGSGQTAPATAPAPGIATPPGRHRRNPADYTAD
jgi:hypothetical protein